MQLSIDVFSSSLGASIYMHTSLIYQGCLWKLNVALVYIRKYANQSPCSKCIAIQLNTQATRKHNTTDYIFQCALMKIGWIEKIKM